MDKKREFAMLASQFGANFSLLCTRYGISRPTGYKWRARYQSQGYEGLQEQNRRPKNIPIQTPDVVEKKVIELRLENPDWGAKKLHRLLENEKQQGFFLDAIPARSTITRILSRNGLIHTSQKPSEPCQRFEYEYPNELWQMDFKGSFSLLNFKSCYPLTITDDHSRFNIGLFACANQRYETVKELLCKVFTIYGKPDTILTDNGSPWGTTGQKADSGGKVYSSLETWLMAHRIKLIHGRAYHPQTQGKEERFHRTLKTELLNRRKFADFIHCQQGFDQYRGKYNCQRPHEGINLDMPVNRYKPSLRTFENVLPKPEYENYDQVCNVHGAGFISYRGKLLKIGSAFAGSQVAVKKAEQALEIYYYDHLIRIIALNK